MLLSVEIGRNIVFLRSALGLTQEELASRADISVSYLRRIEHGTANITIDMLESVSTALGVPPMMLILLMMADDEVWAMIHETRSSIGGKGPNFCYYFHGD